MQLLIQFRDILIGYARVSTDDQELRFQRDALKEAGCKRTFEKKVSGAKRDRPELVKMIEQLRDDDTVVVTRLDRLARSTCDLPLGFQFSTLSTFGSGQAYQVFDASDPTRGRVTSRYSRKNCIKGIFAFCEVNLTLQNRQRLFGDNEVTSAVDFFNVFNNKNYTGFDSFFNNQTNPATGQPFDVFQPADLTGATGLLTLPRRFRFRVGYRF